MVLTIAASGKTWYFMSAKKGSLKVIYIEMRPLLLTSCKIIPGLGMAHGLWAVLKKGEREKHAHKSIFRLKFYLLTFHFSAHC